MISLISVVVGYLLGSVNFSIPMGKWLKGVDLRQHGSGNAGATNSLRVLGKGPAVLVLVLDILKAVLSVLIAHWISEGNVSAEVLAGLAAIIGHNWPVYYHFRGGKGIAATIGFVIALCPLPAMYAGIIGLLVIIFSRYVSLGSLIFTLILPIILLLMGRPAELIWAGVVIFLLAAYRHRKNIGRLLNGTENKLGGKKERA